MPICCIDRAEAFADLGQYWDAIDDLNRAIELAPSRAEAYIYRGTAYRYVDARELALEDIQHGLALAPNSTMGLLERGNLRRLSGDVAGARQDWLRVTELAPQTPEGKAATVNLANLEARATPTRLPRPRRRSKQVLAGSIPCVLRDAPFGRSSVDEEIFFVPSTTYLA